MPELIDNPIQFSPHVEAVIMAILYGVATVCGILTIQQIALLQEQMLGTISNSPIQPFAPQWLQLGPAIFLLIGLRNCWMIWHRPKPDRKWNAKEECEKFRLKGMD